MHKLLGILITLSLILILIPVSIVDGELSISAFRELDVEHGQVLTQFDDPQTSESAQPLDSGAAGVTIPPIQVQNAIKDNS